MVRPDSQVTTCDSALGWLGAGTFALWWAVGRANTPETCQRRDEGIDVSQVASHA